MSAITLRPVNAGLRDECHVEYPDDFPFLGQLVVVCVIRLHAVRWMGLLRGFRSSDLLVFIVLEVTVGVVATIRGLQIASGITVEIPKFCLCKVPEENL